MNEKQLREISENIIREEGFLFIDMVIRKAKQRSIEIFIDSPNALTVDDCMLISRKIENIIDADGTIPAGYHLTVSSPGVDRPLKYLEQYRKNLGKRFKIEFLMNGASTDCEAVLEKIENDSLFFRRKDDTIEVRFSDIISSKVCISFQ